jgi:hypothetical protein
MIAEFFPLSAILDSEIGAPAVAMGEGDSEDKNDDAGFLISGSLLGSVTLE